MLLSNMENSYSWRNMVSQRIRRRFSSPNEKFEPDQFDRSVEYLGALQNESNPLSRQRRRVQRSYTMNTAATDIGQKLPATSPLPNEQNNQVSLLRRFLASNRRKSQPGGSGSTVSRSTDDSEDLIDSPAHVFNSGRATVFMDFGEASTPNKGGPRRASIDFGSSYHATRLSSNRNTKDASMDPKDYASTQARLQRQADDYHKSGQLEHAIETWEQALELAEEHQDKLANKTEFMCILVNLHLQLAEQIKVEHKYAYEEVSIKDGKDVERDVKYHQQAAKHYVHRVKPSLVKPQWFSPTKRLVEFFVDAEAWELAVMVTDQLLQDNSISVGFDRHYLATMHFQVASQNLDQHRQGEALQHLQQTVKHLQQIPLEERNMTMYLQVLQLLASEYHSQKQYQLELEVYEEQLKHAPLEKVASLYCQMASVYINRQQLDEALTLLEKATESEILEASDHASVKLQLLQTQGDVYYRLGRMERSLGVYQEALEEVVNPAEKAKLLYTLGRLCIRLNRTRSAITYFTRELEITQRELGKNHLSVSRVLHELANLYDEGLGEHKAALMKLNKALQIELAVLAECQYAVTQCHKCNPMTHRMCSMHAKVQRDLSMQIRETKKAQGRIHFKSGDFQKALKASFNETNKKR